MPFIHIQYILFISYPHVIISRTISVTLYQQLYAFFSYHITLVVYNFYNPRIISLDHFCTSFHFTPGSHTSHIYTHTYLRHTYTLQTLTSFSTNSLLFLIITIYELPIYFNSKCAISAIQTHLPTPNGTQHRAFPSYSQSSSTDFIQ